MANPNYDQLLSTTLANFKKTLTDNIFKKNVLLWLLSERNRVSKKGGGRNIVEQIMYEEGESNSYGEWDKFTISPVEGITAAEYPWRSVWASIIISGLQDLQNDGEEQIIDLLEAKVKQAEKTLRKKLNTMLHADGTGNTGKDWLGLGALIGDESDSITTVGNINCAVGQPGNGWWESSVRRITAVEALPETELIPILTTQYNNVSDGDEHVAFLLGDQASYELYESLLTPNVRYSDTKSANAGFSNLMFKQAPFYWDRANPTGTVYGVNPEYMKVVGHKRRWFAQTKFSNGLEEGVTPGAAGAADVVDAKYSVITCYGNLTTDKRDAHFKVTGIDDLVAA